MGTTKRKYAFAYLRLSVEEAQKGESASIANQRSIIEQYCRQHGIILIREFADDGWSGGNFDRPGFQEMIRQLEEGRANIVITKDLSRLGRTMRESSYYAEEYFPEHGIHYFTIADNFDNEIDNIMAPLQFAINEVYLRDGSRKVKDVLRNKRENGQYCACPPYGYMKDVHDRTRLTPDPVTAPVVKRIFERAAAGDSSRKIALDLNAAGIIPPLKYRVLYRDNFSEKGAARASDVWNYTTVKRILKNNVYLGNTLLGKTRKPSIKSKKKIYLPKEEWVVTENTHEPLVSEQMFQKAQVNLGKGSSDYRAYDHIRKSIFSGIAVCKRCGYSLCSCGTVYKGEREKYWYLSCTHQRQDIADPCKGVRIKYADLLEVVRQDLNQLLAMSDDEIAVMTNEIIDRKYNEQNRDQQKIQKEKAEARIRVIDRMIAKLYTDNAEGKLDDSRLERMISELERESAGLQLILQELSIPDPALELQKNFERFFRLAKSYTHIEELDRDTLITFVERIEIGPKEYLDPSSRNRNQAYRQSIRIFYKFIGELAQDAVSTVS